MSQIQAAVFDIGNVLLKFDYLVAANRLKEKNGLSELPERSLVVEAKAALEGGESDRAAFLAIVRPHFNDRGTDEEFLRIWEDIFEENKAMTALAARLAMQMPTYLLSNISCIHHDFIFKSYPIFQTFRGGIFSYQARAMKPGAEIYGTLLRTFDLIPQNTVFFDDMPENVVAAAEFGFHAIRYDFRNHAAAERELADLGVIW